MTSSPIASRFRLASWALMATLTALPSFAQSQSPDQKEGQRLLEATLDAHGGRDRFDAFGGLTYHTDGLPYSAQAPLNFDHTADLVARQHRMEGHSAKGSFTAGANATQGWTTDEEALGIPPHWVNHGNSYFVMMPFVFADPGTQARSLGQREYQGQLYDAVAVRFAQGTGDTSEDDYVLYLDRQTHRLRLIDFAVTYGPMRGEMPIDELPRRSLEFVDWQNVDGLWIPKSLHYAPWTRTERGGLRQDQGATYTISNAHFQAQRPDASLFAEPRR